MRSYASNYFLSQLIMPRSFLAGLLELGVSLECTVCQEVCTTACTVLLNPLGSEGAVLDLAQDLLHLLAGLPR